MATPLLSAPNTPNHLASLVAPAPRSAGVSAAFDTLHLPPRVTSSLVPPPAPAGVSAAFDAPVTGALFAVEFVLKSSRLGLDRLSTSTVFVSTSVAAGVVGFLRAKGQVRVRCVWSVGGGRTACAPRARCV